MLAVTGISVDSATGAIITDTSTESNSTLASASSAPQALSLSLTEGGPTFLEQFGSQTFGSSPATATTTSSYNPPTPVGTYSFHVLEDHSGQDYSGLDLTGMVMLASSNENTIYDSAVLDYSVFADVLLSSGTSFHNSSVYFWIVGNMDFSDVDLSTVVGLETTVGDSTVHYNGNTLFPEGFDPDAAGWTLVPTPGSLALIGAGGSLLVLKRRFAANHDHDKEQKRCQEPF